MSVTTEAIITLDKLIIMRDARWFELATFKDFKRTFFLSLNTQNYYVNFAPEFFCGEKLAFWLQNNVQIQPK